MSVRKGYFDSLLGPLSTLAYDAAGSTLYASDAKALVWKSRNGSRRASSEWITPRFGSGWRRSKKSGIP